MIEQENIQTKQTELEDAKPYNMCRTYTCPIVEYLANKKDFEEIRQEELYKLVHGMFSLIPTE